MKNPHPGRWEAGHLHRSLKAQLSGVVWDSQGVLLLGGSGLLANG